MQYIAGGTLQAVIQRVRQNAAGRTNGEPALDVIDESLDAAGRIAAERIVAADLARAGDLARGRLLAGGEDRPARWTTRIGSACCIAT